VNTRFTAAKFAFSWVPSQNGFVLKWQHQDFMEVGGQTPFCWRPGGAIRKLVRYRAYTRSTFLTSRETIQRGSYLPSLGRIGGDVGAVDDQSYPVCRGHR